MVSYVLGIGAASWSFPTAIAFAIAGLVAAMSEHMQRCINNRVSCTTNNERTITMRESARKIILCFSSSLCGTTIHVSNQSLESLARNLEPTSLRRPHADQHVMLVRLGFYLLAIGHVRTARTLAHTRAHICCVGIGDISAAPLCRRVISCSRAGILSDQRKPPAKHPPKPI